MSGGIFLSHKPKLLLGLQTEVPSQLSQERDLASVSASGAAFNCARFLLFAAFPSALCFCLACMRSVHISLWSRATSQASKALRAFSASARRCALATLAWALALAKAFAATLRFFVASSVVAALCTLASPANVSSCLQHVF